MTKHFHRELEKIKKRVLSLGTLVEERVRMATRAIEERDAELAERVIRSDYEIDEMEVEVEEDCLKVLALHQPVAVDLRFLIAVIKINNDLERIGDQAVNIAERVKTMAAKAPFEFVFDYSTMAEKAERMLKKSLDALVNLRHRHRLGRDCLDDEVDAIKSEAYDRIKVAMQENPDRLGLPDQPASHIASSGAPGRPRHQHCRGGGLHDRG